MRRALFKNSSRCISVRAAQVQRLIPKGRNEFKVEYSDGIDAVFFDTLGTIVEPGSGSVSRALQKSVHQLFGVILPLPEINRYTGANKLKHCENLLNSPFLDEILGEHRSAHLAESLRLRLYHEYLTNQCLMFKEDQALLKPCAGFLETFEFMKRQDKKVGLMSGFPRAPMEIVVNQLKALGVYPDVIRDSTDCPSGGVDMLTTAAAELGVPIANVVNVGDTRTNMADGKQAGTYASIGVTGSSAMLELFHPKEFNRVNVPDMRRRQESVERALYSSGATVVIGNLHELPSKLWPQM